MISRSVGFYLSVIGIAMAVLFIKIVSKPEQVHIPPRMPAANPYPKTIAASGIIESVDRNISISPPVSGLITHIYVKISESVKKDQALFQVDPRELEADLLLQKSKVKVAEANLEKLDNQLKRLHDVSDPRAVSQDVLETKANEVKVAQAELESNRAEVERTQKLIERLLVRAPKDGTILQNNIRVGEYYTTASSTPAMLLGDTSKLQVRIDIDEQNASRFRPGFQAVAFPKNNTELMIPLTYERVEPYVVPKKSLTGASNERVDTRVLQVLYTFDKPKNFEVYVGQQVDVFIKDEDSAQ